MATLAFLLDPDQDLPSEQDDWFGRCTAFMSGTWMAWQNFRSKLKENERPLRSWFDAPSLTTNAADFMAHMQPENEKKYKAYVKQQYDDWVKQGKPDIQILGGPADYQAWSGESTRLSSDRLWRYRGLKSFKPKQGKLAAVHHESEPFYFDLRPSHSIELAMLAEMGRVYGGTYLSIWSYGHSLQMVVDRANERHWFSLRLEKPSDLARADLLTGLKQAFEGSRLKPDWHVIEQELNASNISLTRWFLAFGIPGAMELVPAEATELWALMESEGTNLLAGAPVDSANLKNLNKFLVPKLPSKGGKGSARKLFDAAAGLARLLGWGSWAPRQAVADQYWSIVDGPACEHLTIGSNAKGQSASLGRLLAYYQGARLRDGLLLALAAREAESANGHAFVASLEVLAENFSTAGCVLAVFPQELQQKFRSHFGIEDGCAESDQGWSAELFVDLPGLLKADMVKETLAFFKKHKCKGLALRADPGSAVVAHGDLAALFPTADLDPAAGTLSASELAQALGLKLFSIPAEKQSSTPPAGLTRTAVRKGLEAPGLTLRLQLESQDVSYQEQLLQDLGKFFPLRWCEGQTVLAGSCDRVNAELLQQLLGDVVQS